MLNAAAADCARLAAGTSIVVRIANRGGESMARAGRRRTGLGALLLASASPAGARAAGPAAMPRGRGASWVGFARRHRDLRVLPANVAWYILRARRLAERRDEAWACFSSLPADSLARLLDLAGGAGHVVEIGTAMGWTTGALALARRDRTVASYDVMRYDGRAHYLGLLDERTRSRIELVTEPGAAGPPRDGAPVDLLFVDSSHERAETAAEFEAWRPRIRPGGVVAFHDYRNPDFPGVFQAVHADLGLAGEQVGDIFVWRKPR